MLVRKRNVPALSSNASPDCVEAPLNTPQDLGTDATHPGVQICAVGAFGAAAYSFKEMNAPNTSNTVMMIFPGFLTVPSLPVSMS
jgi:hypothetical protein